LKTWLPYHYSSFTEESKLSWVEGVSLIREQKVWLPYQAVSFIAPEDEPLLINSVTTGLACGSSREAAILSGLYEVVERDAFELVWLNRQSMTLVDLEGSLSDDNPLSRIYRNVFKRNHLAYNVVNITSDIDIPV